MSNIEIDIRSLKLILALAKNNNIDDVIEYLEDIIHSSESPSAEKNILSCLFTRGNKVLIARQKGHDYLSGLWEYPSITIDETINKKEMADMIQSQYGCRPTELNLIGKERFIDNDGVNQFVLLKDCGDFTGTFNSSKHDMYRWVELSSVKKLPIAPFMNSLINQASTFLFYQNHAIEYMAETINIDIARETKALRLAVPAGGSILDIGCGSGRDSLYFSRHGYQVTSLDSSRHIAKEASINLGKPVFVRNVLELNYQNKFDGIWASSCLPHLPKSLLIDALNQLKSAIKTSGIIYFSLKAGHGESLDDQDRFISLYTVQEIQSILDAIPDLEAIKIWESDAVRQDSTQRWINVLASK